MCTNGTTTHSLAAKVELMASSAAAKGSPWPRHAEYRKIRIKLKNCAQYEAVRGVPSTTSLIVGIGPLPVRGYNRPNSQSLVRGNMSPTTFKTENSKLTFRKLIMLNSKSTTNYKYVTVQKLRSFKHRYTCNDSLLFKKEKEQITRSKRPRYNLNTTFNAHRSHELKNPFPFVSPTTEIFQQSHAIDHKQKPIFRQSLTAVPKFSRSKQPKYRTAHQKQSTFIAFRQNRHGHGECSHWCDVLGKTTRSDGEEMEPRGVSLTLFSLHEMPGREKNERFSGREDVPISAKIDFQNQFFANVKGPSPGNFECNLLNIFWNVVKRNENIGLSSLLDVGFQLREILSLKVILVGPLQLGSVELFRTAREFKEHQLFSRKFVKMKDAIVSNNTPYILEPQGRVYRIGMHPKICTYLRHAPAKYRSYVDRDRVPRWKKGQCFIDSGEERYRVVELLEISRLFLAKVFEKENTGHTPCLDTSDSILEAVILPFGKPIVA
ncbi:hypothetical protein WN51_07628 [Melipona quadrifasciata]|uniref:Uncharacterized protein n=1 Tax=Melipona quadrifasciata TaxID=166423 RepID=A0A0M8ZR46_9HYME|nr:hypothetical protein WN51_07628 [Melipona quadrifasciata]